MSNGSNNGCLACGSSRVISLSSIQDHEYKVEYKARYASCADCQTAYQAPMPDAQTLLSFYPKDYHSLTTKGVLSRFRNRGRLERIRSLVQNESTSILDYGCGSGAFLLYASELMPKSRFFGYEISDHPQVKKLRNGSVTILEGSLADLLELLPPCILVTMNHVIEHLPDPFSVVSALYNKLLPGGILEGQTPAAGSLEHTIFGPYWSGYHAPRHTVIFSSRGLYLFLKRIGFETVQNTPAFNPASLAVSLASLFQRASSSGIRRHGPAWIFWLGVATMIAPVDLLSGSPAIINFVAVKGEGTP